MTKDSHPAAPASVRQAYDSAPPRLSELANYQIHRLMDWIDGINPVAALLVLLIAAASTCIALAPVMQPSMPDLFGTSGVRIKNTPYQAKWQRAVQPVTHPRAAELLADAQRQPHSVAKIAAVQRAVHGAIRYQTDDILWASKDYWATPNETLVKLAGDCEDVALLKMALLERLGFSASDMFLSVGYDLALRSGHAVLVVRHASQFYVLDQMTPNLLQDYRLTEFRPVITLNANFHMVHSERQNVTLASK